MKKQTKNKTLYVCKKSKNQRVAQNTGVKGDHEGENTQFNLFLDARIHKRCYILEGKKSGQSITPFGSFNNIGTAEMV